MKLRWAALSVVLAFSALMPSYAAGQSGGQPPAPRRPGRVGQNYPNPMNPETRFTVEVGDLPCTDPPRQHRATVRIYNLLSQVVAIPIIEGGVGKAENVVLTCGVTYIAYWDGKYLNSNREAASGVYIYRLDVDGKFAAAGRLLVTK
jgi:hypothetical protein